MKKKYDTLSVFVEPLKRGTHFTFNAIRVLKENVLTFCLHKVLIKCCVAIRNSSKCSI